MNRDTFTIGGVEYRTRVVTLDDISFEELIDSAGLNRRKLLELAIVHADGSEVDFGEIAVGHASLMLGRAMKACGFGEESEEGNA